MKFTRTFDIENDANLYSSLTENNTFELYRERVYTSKGSACTGDWLVQMNGLIIDCCTTLKEAKQTARINDMISSF